MEGSRKMFVADLRSNDDKIDMKPESEKICSNILVERQPLTQTEFHEMFEFVPKRNIIPFVAHHLHHTIQVRIKIKVYLLVFRFNMFCLIIIVWRI